jgi:hypothetical protein
MLTLVSPNLPTVTTEPQYGGVVGSLPTADVGAIATIYDRRENSPLEQSAVLEIPSYADGEIFITAPTGVGAVLSVRLDGLLYSPADKLPRKPGTYTFNPETLELAIALLPGQSPTVGTSIQYRYKLARHSGLTALSNALNEQQPDLFRNWNVSGTVSVSRSLEGQPSGSLEFYIQSGYEASVRSTFTPGEKFIFHGFGYSVNSLKIERLRNGLIKASISLGGYWENELDEPVALNDAAPVTGDDAADGATKGSEKADNCNRGVVGLGNFARRVGVPLRGVNVSRTVPADTPADATTTLGQEVQSRALGAGAVVRYSDPNAVVIERWAATKHHILSAADIVSESISINLQGDGATDNSSTDGTASKLAQEFKNTRLDLDQGDGASADDSQGDVKQVFYSGDRSYFLSVQVDSFRDTGHAFDNGGPTKTLKKVVKLNGQTLTENEQVWGYCYAATDVYTLISAAGGSQTRYGWRYSGPFVNGQAFWRKVSDVSTEYIYGEYGYLVGVKTTGYKLARFNSDRDQKSLEIKLAMVTGVAANSDPGAITVGIESLVKQLALRTDFQKLAVNDTTTYNLAPFRGLYPDIEKGQSEDWVEPLYAERMQRIDRTEAITPDPESTNEKPKPDLVVGKNYREEKSVEIVYPTATIPKKNYQQNKDFYRAVSLTQNAEGPGLKDGLTTEQFDDNSGRPSVQTRLTKTGDRCRPIALNAAKTGMKYLLKTAGVNTTSDKVEDGSVNYPGATTPEEGLKAAETQASIDNTTTVETWELTVLPTRRYTEGDRVTVLGVTFIVLSVTEARKIQGNLVTSDGWQLTLGKYLAPRIELREVG